MFNILEENREKKDSPQFFYLLVQLLTAGQNLHLKNQEPDLHMQWILG